MNVRDYKEVYKQLKSYEDIERLAAETDLDEETLFVIYTEKFVRKVKKDYYKITRNVKKFTKRWKQGETFTGIASEVNFSPIMMTQIILREYGYTKRDVKDALHDYKSITDKRVRQEVREAIDNDMVYSSLGAELQFKRGQEGEEKIRKWLQANELGFREEEHLKGNEEFGGKTVDFLLDEPLDVYFETHHPEEKRKIFWIESKGSFGDEVKIRRDYTKQLSPYTELWGPGMVVYWFGFLEGMEMWLEARDVKVVRSKFFE